MQLKVIKADASLEQYLHTKVIGTINNALGMVGQADIHIEEELAEVVTYFLYHRQDRRRVTSSEIFSVIKAALTATGHEEAAAVLAEHHFERKLNDSYWDGWDSFNATRGIDNVSFVMLNSTSGITRQLYVDEMHFEIEPIEFKIFPEEVRTIVSDKKIGALTNMTYEDLREIIGEDYRFRIEIL